jgi:fructose-bisphosphate aldolase class II
MLDKARAGGYAVMAINAFNLESARGIIQAATELQAPIIIDLLQDHLKAYFDCDVLVPAIRTLVDQTPVPIAINLDHGHDVAHLKRCLAIGFSSVMVDASMKPYEENVHTTSEVVRLAKRYGASVEAEVGCMGCVDDSGLTSTGMFTDPGTAVSFIEDTGIDALAVSYGSTHGEYAADYVPTFDFDIVRSIAARTNCPLVLHGGSGAGEKNILQSIEAGISKINVGTDYMIAQREYLAHELAERPKADYPSLMNESAAAGAAVVRHYIKVSGSSGKARD